MSKSSQERVSQRAVVIHRNGELSQFVDLLESLAVPVDVYTTALPTPDDFGNVAVVIVTGRRLTEPGTPNLSLWPRTLAVVSDSGKTLISHLNRLGVAMVLRRPLHPKTLRLLLLHEVYRGPERRNRKRILIGHPIKVGGSFLKQHGTLLELSPTGARIELKGNPKIGSRLRILIGKDLTRAKPLKLDVEVVRCIRASTSAKHGSEVGVSITNHKRDAAAISELLSRFSRGPATWSGKLDAPSPSPHLDPALEQTMKMSSGSAANAAAPSTVSNDAHAETPDEEIDPNDSARRLPPSYATAATDRAARPHFVAVADPSKTAGAAGPATYDVPDAPEPMVDTPAHAEESDDRRGDARIPYDRRVVALGQEAARILVGRDLSQGGMRIEPTDTVSVGDVFRVALHCGTATEPLILTATALRDDGHDGIVLTFKQPTENQRDHLEKIIASSAPIQVAGEHPENGNGSIVLGEMLEKVVVGQSDDEVSAHIDSIFDTGESV